MKYTLYFFLLFLSFQACRPKDNCMEYEPQIVPDKITYYRQWEKVKLRVMYSERASYRWIINNQIVATNQSELILYPPFNFSNDEIDCEATIGDCIKIAHYQIPIDYIAIPSCLLSKNIININNDTLRMTDGAYDKASATFHARIRGVGASAFDSITIIMPSTFNDQDSINVFSISPIKHYNAYVEMLSGNSVFVPVSTQYQLVYKRRQNGATIECCVVDLITPNYPYSIHTKFSFDIIF
jgi:hypothetical protein